MECKICDSHSAIGNHLMKIAVSGATGFIGQHVVTELEKQGVTPLLLARPSSLVRLSNSKHPIFVLDIENLPDENLYEKMGKPDGFIHCAWSGLPNYQSLHHIEKELPIQYRFITRLIHDGLKNITITGTCFEYGPYSGALHESLIPTPNNPYGFAKSSLLQQLCYFQKSNPFLLTWARLFYIYGEHQSQNALFSQLKKSIQNNEPLFNMSDGEQLRDYLHISDVAKYLVSLTLIRNNNGVVNICSGTPTSIRKLVENWISDNHWNIKLNLGYYPYPDYEPMAFWGDRKKLDMYLDLYEGK